MRDVSLKLVTRLQARLVAAGNRERGDVPGWVMITVMTAGLVFVIWTFLGDYLVNAFRGAIERATQVGG